MEVTPQEVQRHVKVQAGRQNGVVLERRGLLSKQMIGARRCVLAIVVARPGPEPVGPCEGERQVKVAGFVVEKRLRTGGEALTGRLQQLVLETLVRRAKPLTRMLEHHFGDDVRLRFAPADQPAEVVVERFTVHVQGPLDARQFAVPQVVENRRKALAAVAVDEVSTARVAIDAVTSTEHGRQHAVGVLAQRGQTRREEVTADIQLNHLRELCRRERCLLRSSNTKKSKVLNSQTRILSQCPCQFLALWSHLLTV